jgi:UDP-glucose-4-epimerase GalE
MRVLVTGGAGYIGSHTAKALFEAGFEPVVFDNLSLGHRSAVRWGPFVQGDLADYELLLQTLRQYSVGAVVHFAASAYVGESMQRPREYFRNNVANTLNLLDAVLDSGVQQIIVSSSCTVYGEPEELPISEEHARRPVNPYGESKLMVENILKWYGAAYGLKWIALRYFNAAGADPAGELGENHTPETHLIPLVIQAALGEIPEVEIFGTDYPTPDGTAVRDYVHVSDLGEAHVRALNYLLTGGPSAAVNVGTGSGVSVADIVTAVERVSRRSVPVRRALRRPGDPAMLLADNRRSVALLGCTYGNSSITRIVETAWQWHAGSQAHSETSGALAAHRALP